MQDFDASDSDSDRSDSVTDSAFIYKAQAAQKFAAGGLGGPEFDRMSQRLEKDLGLGNDMDSLISVDRGGTDYAQVRARCMDAVASDGASVAWVDPWPCLLHMHSIIPASSFSPRTCR